MLGYSATAGNYLPLTVAQQLDTRPLRTGALKPPSDTAATVASSIITQIAETLCGAKTQAGKLGGSFRTGSTDIPLHGWEVINGKLTYV